MEIWKQVRDYEGLYEVSDLGNVKSLNFNNSGCSGLLKLVVNSRGYYHVGLCKNGKVKSRRVHQLVAESFLNFTVNGNITVINHKDFNRLNNKLNNLEIVTNRENTNKLHIPSSSKFTGVSWYRWTNRWMAYIYNGKKRKHLGYFFNEKEASLAYEKALNEILKN